jgi:hypothetical protein
MSRHVLPDCGRGADLFKSDVQAFHLFGKTAGLPRQGGAVCFSISRSGKHRRECTTRSKLQTCAEASDQSSGDDLDKMGLLRYPALRYNGLP